MIGASFFDYVKEHLIGVLAQSQVDGLNTLAKAFDPQACKLVLPLEWQAYMYATAFHETAHTLQPIREIGEGRNKDYGHAAGKWMQRYYGRGYVQLTWGANYEKADVKLHDIGVLGPNESMVQNAELALRPDVAAAVLIHGMVEGWFTSHKLMQYFPEHGADDWVQARRIINGLDRADLIAGYGKTFLNALRA